MDIHNEEISALPEIENYTPVIILPSLKIGCRLVFTGRFPGEFEVIAWLLEVIR